MKPQGIILQNSALTLVSFAATIASMATVYVLLIIGMV